MYACRGMRHSTSLIAVAVWFLASSVHLSSAEDCGSRAGSALCPANLCCSKYGYCGSTKDYCGEGCQSQCRKLPALVKSPTGSCAGITCLITESMFERLWPNRNEVYTYKNFVTAAKFYPQIGTQGSRVQKLQEIAAFAAHVQQETAGLLYTTQIDKSFDYCDKKNREYPCASGKKYFGRGPLQLAWNYNYGAARDSGIGRDLLAFPELVSQDGVIAFRTSFWFWTRTDHSIPSIHDVMVGKWKPSRDDTNNNRLPGFGQTINIINGDKECGHTNEYAKNRIKYYQQFCKIFGVGTGKNLHCSFAKPY